MEKLISIALKCFSRLTKVIAIVIIVEHDWPSQVIGDVKGGWPNEKEDSGPSIKDGQPWESTTDLEFLQQTVQKDHFSSTALIFQKYI